ncbi:SurA N-terminal domain-containing protein [Fodinibius sp.]|uniref:SurA N-terminal domain-containing protein n=1 Tax=Fodinibius sp. TaxID=1872440 RepID=UPI002ACE79AD|nr:SurA N-terminal domain-containing protein [Fodinibius sp.]MDZ7659974.1 SurA N-terminal domain-containing protein [Fodinibius sp.]
MDKMRKSTGVILWILIFSFGVLWMLADTNMFDVIQQGPRTLGSVNGESISLEEYNNRLQYYTQQYSQQTGNSMTPEVRAQYEQQAWDDLVNSRLLQDKMDDLGIHVTDQEVVNMITGPNPDPLIRQNFSNEDGTIDRVALKSWVEAPENKQLLISIEQQMRQKRQQQKMNNYLQSSMDVSDYEVEQQYIRNNTRADVSFVRFPYADVSDSEISVSEDELREYYNNNQDEYKRKKSYRISYVSFDKTPTKKDTARTFEEMNRLKSDFATAESDSLFFNRYQSSTAYEVKEVAKDEIRELFRPVLNVAEGEVTDVIQDGGRLFLLKKLDETANEVTFTVFSRDITADPIATIDARAETADDFSFYAQEDGFEAEAKRRDLEIKEGFATKGNNFVSGIGQSQQIMRFLDTANEGQISDPLELNEQFVVIKVNEITEAGTEPFEEVKDQIETVVTNNKRKQQVLANVKELIGQNSDLESIAKATGKEVMTVESLTKSAATIEGAGREPKVVGAIFGLDEGEQSPPVEGTSAAFVVRLDKLYEADLDNLTADVRQRIRQQLRQQKSQTFMNTWIEQLREEADIEDNRAQLLRG